MYKIWGREQIAENAIEQMSVALSIPPVVSGALMPDAHLGYGLPIGGVLALDNAVCPYAVGVDIACRMKLTVFDNEAESLGPLLGELSQVLETRTHFGVGVTNPTNPYHSVLHEDWDISQIVLDNYDRAEAQLGTSGSGNHFVEWGEYNGNIALLSHSGSRGPGAQVCNYYSRLAKQARPEYGEMAWFDMDSELGQEYWAAMNLMGKYASANHDCIHRAIAKRVGWPIIETIENHHNFAWKETHGGREVIVHRKGATPAGVGVLGVIPGSMGTPTYVVRGKGNPDSLCSSSHGAGRVMSRTQAKKVFNYELEIAKLAVAGITVLSAGTDEVCGVYKDIHQVIAAQDDLVEVVGQFHPKIVKMCPGK